MAVKITPAQVTAAIADQSVTALRTATRSARHVAHALPDAPVPPLTTASYIAACGADMTGQWLVERDGEPQVVTCRSCVRALLKRPEIRITIETSHQTSHERTADGSKPDHSRCQHTSSASDPFNHDEGCPWHPGSECGCYHGCICICECDCSLSDEECDSVGGRYLDGNVRYLGESTEVLEFDPEVWAGLNNGYGSGLTLRDMVEEYMEHQLRHGGTRRFDCLPWRPEEYRHAELTMRAGEDDGDSREVWTEFTLRVSGPGVGGILPILLATL